MSVGALQTVGLGIITGAADDDPSAVGTYASAGAAFGLLGWLATATMFAATLGLALTWVL